MSNPSNYPKGSTVESFTLRGRVFALRIHPSRLLEIASAQVEDWEFQRNNRQGFSWEVLAVDALTDQAEEMLQRFYLNRRRGHTPSAHAKLLALLAKIRKAL